MKTHLSALILMALFAGTPVVHALDFANHAFFKQLIGTWKAEGELKGEDNKLIKITEDWIGKADGDSGFSMEGTRSVNGDIQPFKWTFSHNPAIDSYEAILTGGEGSQPIRFEGSFSEVEMVMTLKAITGSGNGSITVQESLLGDAKDTLESKVTFIGDQGQTTLEGTITDKKSKSP